MTIVRILINIPFIVWFVVAGGLGYMDFKNWETDILNPLIATRDTKKNELATKQKELARAEEFTRRREEKLKELQDLTLRLEGTKAALPRASSIPALLKDLADISDRVGLLFSRFKPETDRRRKFLVETPISVELKGTYVQIMSFLDGAANIERIVATERLSLDNPVLRGPTSTVTATATLITYHIDEGVMASGAAAAANNAVAPGAPTAGAR
jgi:type IV pilus assembly protein PilO